MATSSKAKKKTVRLASGLKRARQDVKLNAANTALRSKFRTVIKNVQKAVAAGDKDKAAETLQDGAAVIDSVADKGLFHKNKAARHKSRLSAKVKALALRRLIRRRMPDERARIASPFSWAGARQSAQAAARRPRRRPQLVVAGEVHHEVPGHRLDARASASSTITHLTPSITRGTQYGE